MILLDQGDGVVVEIDDTEWTVRAPSPSATPAARRTRGGLPTGPVPIAPTLAGVDEVTAALGAQGFRVLKEIPLDRHLATTRSAAPRDPVIKVTPGPDEHAVVLIAKDGVYEWVLPDEASADPAIAPTGASRLRSGPSSSPRELTFQLRVSAPSPATARTRGWASTVLGGGFRAFVLKFVARAITPIAIGFLERNVRTALVSLDSTRPESWGPANDGSVTRSSQPRVLLFVHGTFSSTIGAFHGLAATIAGNELLQWAWGYYDDVIGYDHATLSLDPYDNARDLSRRLQERYGDANPRIDIVCHSRGGLVIRSLVERVLPTAAWRPRVGRVVMVACTNGGTHLAEPENWKSFVDLYTSLAANAVKLVSSAFGGGAVGTLLEEALKAVGALVQHLAVHAIAENGVPGLAAMRPTGPFVAELNRTNPGQPDAAASQYQVVTSEFEPNGVDTTSAGAMTTSLVSYVVDHLADGLIDRESDLVVDTASMDRIDPHVGGFVDDRYDYGRNGWVHHLAYFTREETARALRRWLDLEAGTRLPAAVDDHVWIVHGHTPVETLVRLRSADASRAILIRRPEVSSDTMYAFAPDELERRLGGATSGTLREALDLRESDASPPARADALPAAASPVPASGLTPVTSGGAPVGVLLRGTRSRPDILRSPLPAPVPSDRSGTRRLRSGTALATLPDPATAAATARVHAQAEMPGRIRNGAAFDVMVQLSREAITPAAAGIGAAKAALDFDTTKKLRISVWPRSNVELAGDSVWEVEVPLPGEPALMLFPARAVDQGPAEVWVIVRQGQKTFAQLRLVSTIVAATDVAIGGRAEAAADADPARVLVEEPAFTLRVFENRIGDKRARLRFELESIPHDLRDVYEGPEINDLPAFVSSMYTQLETDWVSHKNDAAVLDLKLRAYGARLYQELLPRELRESLWTHRNSIRAILVLSTETYVPWEMLHMCDPATASLPAETIFLGQKGLVRWLHGVSIQPAKIEIRPGLARHIVPDYPDPAMKLPGAQQEASFMQGRFGSTSVGPEANDVYSLLKTVDGFDMLHFAGHGEADSAAIAQAAVLMQGRMENGNWIPSRVEALLVEQLPKREQTARPVVFLNACQVGRAGRALGSVGGFAKAFLHRGAGVFVAPLWAVGDLPAFTFGQTFYDQFVSQRKPLAEAVTLAREAAAQSGDPSWIAYAVYGHHEARVT